MFFERPRPNRPGLCLAGLLAALLQVFPGTGHAQSIGTLAGGSAAPAQIVEGEDMKRAARESFEELARRSMSSPPTEAERSVVRKTSQAFDQRLERKLVELRGDGALTLDEVTEAFGELREVYENELLTVISAVKEGRAPPPLKRDFTSNHHHAWALTRYTFLERNSGFDWLRLLGWVLAGLAVAWAVIAGAKRLRAAIHNPRLMPVRNALGSLAGPLYLAALALGIRFGAESIWLPEGAREIVESALQVALITALFWLAWNACTALATAVCVFIRRTYGTHVDHHMHSVVLRVFRVMVLAGFIGVIIHLVMDSSFTGMLTGLGVLGVALYFILNSTFQNLAASFMIFGDRPFRMDDLIVYDGHWGTVERIGFRSTQVRTLSGHLLTIPNSKLIEDAIYNVGARPTIRRRFRIGLVYQTPPEKIREAMDIIHDLLDDYEGKPEDEPVYVRFERFGDYDLQLLVQYHFAPPDYWRALEFDTEINLAILERFADAGIDIAYPTYTQHLNFDERLPVEWRQTESTRSASAQPGRPGATGESWTKTGDRPA